MIAGPGSKETEYNKIAYSTSKDLRTKNPKVFCCVAEEISVKYPSNEDWALHFKHGANGR